VIVSVIVVARMRGIRQIQSHGVSPFNTAGSVTPSTRG
jgi:hypothetical protein